jgi:hypothetical protein
LREGASVSFMRRQPEENGEGTRIQSASWEDEESSELFWRR